MSIVIKNKINNLTSCGEFCLTFYMVPDRSANNSELYAIKSD